MKQACYFNGRITTINKINISPYDIGMLRGYGVFDVMAAFNSKPFLLKEHFKRLQNSARELKLKVPFSQNEYEKILDKLIKLNGFKEATIRTIITGGISADAFSIGKLTAYILVEKFHDYPREIYQKGAKLISLEHERFCPHAKITNYVEAIRNQELKKKNKALEILFVKNGKVLEASTSNIFIVKNGKIITTKEKILLGITRNLVIKLAKKEFELEERELSYHEVIKADEVFLTATNKHIVPIVKIDQHKIGNGKPGVVTSEVNKLYEEFRKKVCA
jgi:branched-chain amino acid aminotransferase